MNLFVKELLDILNNYYFFFKYLYIQCNAFMCV